MIGEEARHIYWTSALDERLEAARFFAAHIRRDASYISHGEIQTGLSVDGKSWASDLERRFIEDLSTMEDGQKLAVMRDASGAMIAAALVQWEETPRVKFGVLEDLAVPPALRSAGLGARMVAWIDAEARLRQCRWMFLESGKHNTRAHAFFEQCGFAEMSHVFVKEYR
jgi:N-acetylglutamate synthase-like GNAT family acetyltransferase